MRTKKALGRFIDQDLLPEDQVALVTTSGAGAISQEFTADRAALRQTLSRLSVQDRRAGWTGVPYLSDYQAELIEAGDPTALDAAVQEILASGIEQDAGAAESIARNKARAITEEGVYNSRLVLESLEGLCRGLSGLSGRKAIFFFSDGFLTGMTTNRASTGFDVRRIADAATRAAVVIYSLDTRGLIASPPVASASSLTRILPATSGNVEAMRHRGEEATREAMNALAADTGGFMIENSNDLRSGLHEMLKDTETYYVLAYEPTNTKRDGSFRKIEVRLPNVHGVKLRTRSGYFAPDDRRRQLAAAATAADEARRAEQRRAEMTAALHSLAPLDGIPVRVSADFVGPRGRHNPARGERQHRRHQAAVRAPARTGARRRSRAWRWPSTRTARASRRSRPSARRWTCATPTTSASQRTASRTRRPPRSSRGATRSASRCARRERACSAAPGSGSRSPTSRAGRLTLSSLFLLHEAGGAQPAAEAARAAGDAPDLKNAQALRRYRKGESLYAQIYAYNPKLDAGGATRLFAQAEILRQGVTLGKAAPEAMESGAPKAPPVPHTSRIRLAPLRARRLRAADDGERRERQRPRDPPRRVHGRRVARRRYRRASPPRTGSRPRPSGARCRPRATRSASVPPSQTAFTRRPRAARDDRGDGRARRAGARGHRVADAALPEADADLARRDAPSRTRRSCASGRTGGARAAARARASRRRRPPAPGTPRSAGCPSTWP